MAMPGGIDHLMINCREFDAALEFYAWLMPKLGYGGRHDIDEPVRMTGFYGQYGSFWISPPAPEMDQTFNKTRTGLREIAFRVTGRSTIDLIAPEIEVHGGRIIDLPREYDYRPKYYAIFFTDPDGIKLELVHYPD
jgi:glyoxylase I family protein